MAYNLAQLRTVIDSTSFPAGSSAPTKTNLINRARERIYNTTVGGGWKGGDVTATLKVVTEATGSNQFVTMPLGLEAIVGVYGTGGLYNLQNEWFGFTRSAPGSAYASMDIGDLGDGFVTFIDLPATGLQPIFTTQGAATITLIGLDMAGNYAAETITAGSAGTYVATHTYSEIDSVELNSGGVLPPPTSPLPTSDPHIVGAYWNDGGVVAISAG